MSDRWPQATEHDSFRFFSPEHVDQILRDGAQKGRLGSHAAIERILKLESGIERASLWRRIRQLKFPSNGKRHARSRWSSGDDQVLARGYENGWFGKQKAVRALLKCHPDWQPHVIWKRAAKLHLGRRLPKRWQERSHLPWSAHDNDLLLNLAGYKTPRFIAKLLHRSEAAVRYHLMILGKSSRVHSEGFSRKGLATDLHLGKKTIQRLIVEGLLEVRDPRITRESLEALGGSGRFNWPIPNIDAPGPGASCSRLSDPTSSADSASATSNRSRAERVWAETARSLGIPIATLKALISQRALKLYDPTITEKSFRHFCRRYGSLINYEFLNRETRAWLEASMDFVRRSGEAGSLRLTPLRKHAYIVRQCAKCGRAIRGNVFFRHIKLCAAKPSGTAA
ncbi:MAG: hypothetical protein ACRD8A_00125 [Candidatus Acidiferrales bacterium]